MPEKSGIDAALCAAPPAGRTVDGTTCPKADVAAAAANATDTMKSRRCTSMIFLRSFGYKSSLAPTAIRYPLGPSPAITAVTTFETKK
jgi:hypothetical protein